MIVHFFQWRLRPGFERRFEEAWMAVTIALRAEGSEGSALFDGPDGTVCAIARWPSAATRQASSAERGAAGARARMLEAIEETLQSMALPERVNLWAPYPSLSAEAEPG